jgi:beta-lactamase class A
MNRRRFLWSGSALVASPALARPAPIPAIADYESACGGHIGLHARNLRTGASLSWRANERFVMCSTFKASLAALVLHRVDRGQETLDQPIALGPADARDVWAPVAQRNLAKGRLSVEEACMGAVEESDNACANLLLARVGGPRALTAFWRAMGDPVSRHGRRAAPPDCRRGAVGGVARQADRMDGGLPDRR